MGVLACSLRTGADRRSPPVRIVDSELLGPLHDVVQQHRPSHRAHATRYRRDPARHVVHAAVKITDQTVDDYIKKYVDATPTIDWNDLWGRVSGQIREG